MSPTEPQFSLLQLLRQQLEAARSHDEHIRAQHASGQIIQVPGTGKAISSAYEQLRNAAEYTEEHLLLQRAIKRFYKRSFSFFAKRNQVKNIGEELIVELTQAGYLRDNQFSLETASQITHLSESYLGTYSALRKAHVARDDAAEWVLPILSVEVERILNPHSRHSALAYAVYQHFLHTLPKDLLVTNAEEGEVYEISLYIAVHQALLKSDMAVVRHDLMRMYQQSPQDIDGFAEFNKRVTGLFVSRFTARLKRAVSKHGAPFRILKAMVDDRPDVPEILENREVFLMAYDQQTAKEYKQVNSRLNKGIIKSIIFIFITKVVIGISIEVPYDHFIMGTIPLIPLAINLLFPPLYMATLRLGLKVPTQANAHTLRDYITKTLYTGEHLPLMAFRDPTRTVPGFQKLLYGLLFLIPFAVTVYLLLLLHFNIVQMVIFFVFMSTASFLGFRLSSMIRELELMTPRNRLLTTIRDFFYLPFIVAGQWLSSKYARINAVAHILDIVIELPLKTVLRLLRQWSRFLNEKHDELY
jgi:hypothetical protein